MANKPVLFAIDDLEVLRAVERKYAEGLPKIYAHDEELDQVWTNLVNAMNGRVKLRVKTSHDGGEYVLVEITDDGPASSGS
jgi:nitrogen-specific signal transduction histidine kinase